MEVDESGIDEVDRWYARITISLICEGDIEEFLALFDRAEQDHFLV